MAPSLDTRRTMIACDDKTAHTQIPHRMSTPLARCFRASSEVRCASIGVCSSMASVFVSEKVCCFRNGENGGHHLRNNKAFHRRGRNACIFGVQRTPYGPLYWYMLVGQPLPPSTPRSSSRLNKYLENSESSLNCSSPRRVSQQRRRY